MEGRARGVTQMQSSEHTVTVGWTITAGLARGIAAVFNQGRVCSSPT